MCFLSPAGSALPLSQVFSLNLGVTSRLSVCEGRVSCFKQEESEWSGLARLVLYI